MKSKIAISQSQFLLFSLLGPIISFDDEEEDGGDFKVKKSKASRMIKRMRQAPNAMSIAIERVEVVTEGTSIVTVSIITVAFVAEKSPCFLYRVSHTKLRTGYSLFNAFCYFSYFS